MGASFSCLRVLRCTVGRSARGRQIRHRPGRIICQFGFPTTIQSNLSVVPVQETVNPLLLLADSFAPPAVVSSNTRIAGCEVNVGMSARLMVLIPPEHFDTPAN